VPLQEPNRYRLSPSRDGKLRIWTQPQQGRAYVIGADASGGGPDGDFAAAVVIDAETCAVVATWRDHTPAIPWGKCCARLGWYFGTALLSFETFPSAHGLSAAHAAVATGYQNLFRNRMYNRASRDTTDDLGFHTNSITKPQLLDRLKLALDDGCDIPATELIEELRAQRWDKPKTGMGRIGAPKMVSDDHDDLVMAYGVALMTRDTAWVAGQLRTEKPRPSNESERYWAMQRNQEGTRRRFQRRA